ncbi:MAG: type sorting protein [Chitinophagaceae bacterium]|nr:type sorting protein [Chitinophagaceae bacterium]
MKRHFAYPIALFFLGLLTISGTVRAQQIPCNVLVGYYQTSWGSQVRLKNINSNYNVICLSFLEAGGGDGDGTNNVVDDLSFYASSWTHVATDIATLQAQGKIVLMSIGGADGSFKLNSAADVTTFVNKTKAIIQTYGVNGIDIDMEQQTYLNQTGTISAPSAHIANLISGLQQLRDWYQTYYSRKMVLTLVPETAYVTGGLSNYESSTYGVPYLAIIEAMRNDIDLLMVQLYNVTSEYGLDGYQYAQGTMDFVISQTDAIIKGFTCKNSKGVYSGLPASKVVVMLPADPAGNGYMDPTDLQTAINYLKGNSTDIPDSYFLQTPGGYPGLRGLGTWSINIDYSNSYAFATNYTTMFNCVSTATEEQQTIQEELSLYPNPATQQITIEKVVATEQHLEIVNVMGEILHEQEITDTKTSIDISALPAGLYVVKMGDASKKLMIQ